MVDGVDQAPGDLLQHAEVEHEEAFGVDRALDRHAYPIVMAVECFALVPAEGDEVGRGEDQIVLADLDPKLLCTAVLLNGPIRLKYNDEQARRR